MDESQLNVQPAAAAAKKPKSAPVQLSTGMLKHFREMF